MPKTKKKLFDKEESLTKLVGDYHQAAPGRTSTQFTYYSFLDQDKKSKRHGMNRLRKYAVKNVDKIEIAGIFDNISGELIEKVIIKGQIV